MSTPAPVALASPIPASTSSASPTTQVSRDTEQEHDDEDGAISMSVPEKPKARRTRSPLATDKIGDAAKAEAGEKGSGTGKKEDEKEAEKKSLFDKFRATLPDYISSALVDRRKWKIFVRCMVAQFCMLVLVLDQRSLDALGNAAFFGLIASQMLPPNMAVSIYTFAFGMVVFGICMGWAWGSAAMAAALRARSQVLLQEEITREESTYTSNTNIDAQYQASIFRGAFLDPRSSAVFGVFLFLGAYFFGWVRAKKPRMTLAAIFGTIILDRLSPDGVAHNNLVIPAACFFAISLSTCFLIFPQTLHAIVLDGILKGCLGPIQGLLKLQDEVLTASPSDHETWTALAAKARGLRKGLVMAQTGLGMQVPMLQLEVSHSRMSPGELGKLFEKVKEIGARATMLPSFLLVVEERYQSFTENKGDPGNHPIPRSKRDREEQEKYRREGMNLDTLIPILESSTADLRTELESSLAGWTKWLDELNHTRWGKPKPDSPTLADREASLAKLKAVLAEFRSSKSHEILEPFHESFDPDTGKLRPDHATRINYTARDLFRCYLLTTSLTYFADTLIEWFEALLEMERNTPKNKWQWPTKFTQVAYKVANASSGGGSPLDTGSRPVGHEEEDGHSEASTLVGDAKDKDVEKGQPEKEKKHRVYPKDPDAREPKNGVQRFGRSLTRLWRALTSPAGLFALKQGLVSIALWAPAVIPSSAYFVYTNRGLWALIMSQTGMGVFTGEQIGAFILRMSGTIAGLIIGMLAWYIGSGHGDGNPYGVAAATMVLLSPILFWRAVAPQPKIVFPLMTGVTAMLIIGYGWIDTHTYQTANQGYGAPLAGRRALLVIIGFTAAFIMMLFPKPNSAKLIVRRTLAKNLSEISDLYSSIVTGVEDEADLEEDVDCEDLDVKTRQGRYRAKFVKLLTTIGGLEPQMAFAGLEPGLKGPWPKEEYAELAAMQAQSVMALAILSGAYARLTPKWCRILAQRSDYLHPAFIADCLALFALLQQSLSHGSPLPATIPIFERLHYHHTYRTYAHHGTPGGMLTPHGSSDHLAPLAQLTPMGKGDYLTRRPPADRTNTDEDGMDRIMNRIKADITWDTIRSEQFAVYASASVGLVHVVNGLNQIHRIVYNLVGEKDSEGFDRAQERWEREEVTAAAY